MNETPPKCEGAISFALIEWLVLFVFVSRFVLTFSQVVNMKFHKRLTIYSLIWNLGVKGHIIASACMYSLKPSSSHTMQTFFWTEWIFGSATFL